MEIILTGDERLAQVCRELTLEEIKGDYAQNLAAEMIKTASAIKDTLGLAAPQVGEVVRLFIMRTGLDSRVTPLAEKEFEIMFNPKITKIYPGKSLYREGCLSEPGISAVIERYHQIKVKYVDENGSQRTLRFKNTDAIVFQHELDHLNGKLMTDVAVRITKDAPSVSELESSEIA